MTELDAGRPLAVEATRVVSSAPGVVRLEPSLRSALGRLSRPVTATDSATDGVVVVRRGRQVDVSVDLTVDDSRPALATADEVQRRLREAIRAAGLVPGQVSVNILAVEPGRGRP